MTRETDCVVGYRIGLVCRCRGRPAPLLSRQEGHRAKMMQRKDKNGLENIKTPIGGGAYYFIISQKIYIGNPALFDKRLTCLAG